MSNTNTSEVGAFLEVSTVQVVDPTNQDSRESDIISPLYTNTGERKSPDQIQNDLISPTPPVTTRFLDHPTSNVTILLLEYQSELLFLDGYGSNSLLPVNLNMEDDFAKLEECSNVPIEREVEESSLKRATLKRMTWED